MGHGEREKGWEGRWQGERWRGRIGDRVDKAADVIREIQGPSISDENERSQLNIGLTKNTTTLVRYSRSCHSFPARIIRYIKIIYLSPIIYISRLGLRTDRFLFFSFSLFFPSSASFGEECLATQSHVRHTLLAGRIYAMSLVGREQPCAKPTSARTHLSGRFEDIYHEELSGVLATPSLRRAHGDTVRKTCAAFARCSCMLYITSEYFVWNISKRFMDINFENIR